MYIVLLLAAFVIIGGVVVVAMGWGGELAYFRRDRPAFAARARTPWDVATMRPPVGLFGYQQQATAEALRGAARLLAERDEEIARLREQVWRLTFSADDGTSGSGAPASQSDVLSGTTGGVADGPPAQP